MDKPVYKRIEAHQREELENISDCLKLLEFYKKFINKNYNIKSNGEHSIITKYPIGFSKIK